MNKEIRNPNSEIRNKFEDQNPKAELTASNHDSKRYDLEDRTFEFARASRAFVKRLPRTIANIEDAKQFIRSSGSIGANYIEANESIGKKDFLMKVKTCRREAKESSYWLRLLDCKDELDSARAKLLAEARELMKIFGAIVRKSEGRI
jgi:four helix bundle protein